MKTCKSFKIKKLKESNRAYPALNYNWILLQRNKHCWDWWNLESLSDNEEVFEKPCDKTEAIPQLQQQKSKTLPKKSKKPTSDSGKVKGLKTCDLIPDRLEYNNIVYHHRKEFIRAKSAEPESRLSRQKSESLPDVHKGLVGEYFMLLTPSLCNIGDIFSFIKNSWWCLYATQSDSGWLYITESRGLQADWLILDNHEKATLHIMSHFCDIGQSCNIHVSGGDAASKKHFTSLTKH